MKKKLHKNQFGINFECCHCGECCKTRGRAYLYPNDVHEISANLGCSIHDFIEKYCEYRVESFKFTDKLISFEILAILKMRTNACGFLDGGACQIQHCKPLQCRLAPFIDPIITEESIWKEFYENCSGFNRGEFWNLNDIIPRLNTYREARALYYKDLNENGMSLEKLLKTEIDKEPVYATVNINMQYDVFMNRKVNLVNAIMRREVN